MEIIAIQLKKARVYEGLTQKEIASRLHIPLKTYKNYESRGKGRRIPDAEMLSKLADVLHVTVDYLLGRD